jgi:cytochrome o ubiquinol oxidase subunit 2
MSASNKGMNKKSKLIIASALIVWALAVAVILLWGNEIPVLQPKGVIADREHDLMVTTILLSLIVVVPVFALTIFIAWKYRAANTQAEYKPEWDGSRKLEFTWWVIPSVIILVLSVIAWRSSHQLDPFKPLESATPPVTIQVVALQWKWLFIYPDQQIATVNYVQFPEKTPVNFVITADAPMNSFWIPSLGGQIYAMSGMSTKLHLMANETGVFDGSSANISGKGFAGMKFKAEAVSQDNFYGWMQSVKQSSNVLNMDEYEKLAKPSENSLPSTYASVTSGLYDNVIMKYMAPPKSEITSEMMPAGIH